MESVLSVVILIAIIVLLSFQKLREKPKKSKKQKATDSIYMGIWWFLIFISGIVLYMLAFFQLQEAKTFSYIFSTIAISIESSIRMFGFVFKYDGKVKEIANSNWIYCAAIVICYIAAICWTTLIAERLFFRRITNEFRLWLRTKLPKKRNEEHYIIVGCEKSMDVFLSDLEKKVSKDNIIIITGLPIENKADSNIYFKKFIENGYVAINGKADKIALKRAGIDKIRRKTKVIAITESDEQNLAVAQIITEEIKSRQGAIEDINLEAYIMYSFIERTEHFVFAEEARGKVDFFNPYELRVRDFFEEHSITKFISNLIDTNKARLKGEFNADGKIYKPDGHEYLIKNIFVGFGNANYQMLKGSILSDQLLGCNYNATIYDKKIRVDKFSIRQAMFMNHSSGLFPSGDQALEGEEYFESPKEKYNIDFKTGNVLSRDFYAKNGLIQDVKNNDFTVIYVALGEDKLSIETACEIRQCLYKYGIKQDKIRIFVKVCDKTAFNEDSVINHKDSIPIHIECFGWNKSVFTKGNIVNCSLDDFAKRVTNKNHETSWELLPETKRDINRQVAMSIKTKLHLLGFNLLDENKNENSQTEEDYYKRYIGDGNDKISKIIELSKKIADHNNTVEELYELKQEIEKTKEELEKIQKERSNYKLDYVKVDSDGKISDTPRNNLARYEHLRWNSFHLIRGWTKMPKSKIYDGNNGRQDKLTKQHACITTFEELIKLRELQAQKMLEKKPEISSKEAIEKSDTIWYDYNLMDELPVRLLKSGKIIGIWEPTHAAAQTAAICSKT